MKLIDNNKKCEAKYCRKPYTKIVSDMRLHNDKKDDEYALCDKHSIEYLDGWE